MSNGKKNKKEIEENKLDMAKKTKPKTSIKILEELIKDVKIRLAQENTKLQQLQQALQNTKISINNTQVQIVSLGGESVAYEKALKSLRENK